MEQYRAILNSLMELPGAVRVNDDQIRIHCPICDKKDNKLYVGLNRNPAIISKGVKLLGYNCKQCPFSGNVGKRFYEALGIKYTKDMIISSGIKTGMLRNIGTITKYDTLKLKIPNFIRPEDRFKVDYLSSRFNRQLTVQDIQKYKIILNFNDLFDYNGIPVDHFENPDNKERRRKLQYLAKEFSAHFVGMLSADNNKINLRNINSQKFANKRYMVHVINPNIGNPYIYIPSTEINLLSPNPTICMAEGNFDIIGAKELFYPEDRSDMIFVAIGTRTAYKRALTQVMKMTGFVNANIHIFADNDADTNLEWYKKMFSEWRSLFDKITIHYNIGEYDAGNGHMKPCKDFGDLSKPVVVKSYDI